MFVRLDRLSHKEERHRIYSKIPEGEPSDAKRHRFCHSTPWDSYQWAAGSLLIAISQIFLGVCFPALSGNELGLGYVWLGLFVVLWLNLGIFTCIDPSVGQSVEDAKTARAAECCEPHGMVSPEAAGGGANLNLYCRLSGCRRFYSGKYRKHCKACNKCVEGFDHHCPFLNQCIGTNNYFYFMTILTIYIALMLVSIVGGLYIVMELNDQESSVFKFASKVWGIDMYMLFMAMLVLFPVPKLYFMVPLWIFHLKLCSLSITTGGFFGTYMFTRSPTTNDLRGRVGYLDQRAARLIERIVYRTYMDRYSAFQVWSTTSRVSSEVRACRRAIENTCLGLLTGVIEKASGITMTSVVNCGGEGPGGPAGRGVQSLGKEALNGFLHDPTTGPGFSESDPLLKQVIIDEPMDMPLPAPSGGTGSSNKGGGIFSCVPCRSKRNDE